jgi:WD40 repeat protein
VTSSNDLRINFWDITTLNLVHSISVPELQIVLRYANWSSTAKYLYTGGSDSAIRYYDVLTYKFSHKYNIISYKEVGVISNWSPYQKNTDNIKGHFGAITDIIPIYS